MMWRRVVAAAMVTTLAVGSATHVFAATSTPGDQNSEAGVGFKTGPDGIIPPDILPPEITVPPGWLDPDPDPDPEDPSPPGPILPPGPGEDLGLTTMHIDFGEHELPVMAGMFGYWSLGNYQEPGGTPKPFENGLRYGGKRATADIVVVATDSRYQDSGSSAWWEVTVAMNSGFKTDDSTPLDTIEGFKIGLKPFAQDGLPGADATRLKTHQTGAYGIGDGIGYDLKFDNGDGTYGKSDGSYPVAEGRYGVFGLRYEGLLSVPGGSALVGESQAEILWTFTPEKP